MRRQGWVLCLRSGGQEKRHGWDKIIPPLRRSHEIWEKNTEADEEIK